MKTLSSALRKDVVITMDDIIFKYDNLSEVMHKF